jgi:peptidoglycan/xylan/chitin deacetylase (PgdA/CDA1 family)
MAEIDLRRSTRRALKSLSRPIHPLLGSIREVRTQHPIAALTFDDGPDERQTRNIVDVLARYDAKATFFMLARRAEALPEIVALVRSAGHEIALHGDDHSPLVDCSTREKFRKIRSGKRRLEGLLGHRVAFFRPPYGWQDVRAFVAARTAGLEVIGWSTHGSDWLDLMPRQVADRAADNLKKGSIILLHDRTEPAPNRGSEVRVSDPDRAQVVEELFGRAADRGIRLVALGHLLAAGTPLRRPWFWRPIEISA